MICTHDVCEKAILELIALELIAKKKNQFDVLK